MLKSEVVGVTFSDFDFAPVPKFLNPDLAIFQFENPTHVQTPATIIDPTVTYPCFYLRNEHTDSYYCRNWKVTPVFPKFLTPGPHPCPKEKRRTLPESTPVSSEISDLLLPFSYFASQNKKIKSDNYFFYVCYVNQNIWLDVRYPQQATARE